MSQASLILWFAGVATLLAVLREPELLPGAAPVVIATLILHPVLAALVWARLRSLGRSQEASGG